jgi:hypothetical protein
MLITIGGMLVFLLLGQLAEPVNAQNKMIILNAAPTEEIKYLSYDKEQYQQLKIGELIGSINEKNRNLKSLLKEKSNLLDKIQTLLDFRVYSKSPLSESQINSFTSFTGFYSEEAGVLQETLRKIDDEKDLRDTKKELLHNDADYSAIIEELKSFNDSQASAIGSLRNIIEVGNRTLQVL